MKLNGKTIVALEVLNLLTGKGRLKTREIHESIKSSRSWHCTEDVVGLLCKAGVLLSERGRHGGVTLRRRPTVLELIEIMEGFDYDAETARAKKVMKTIATALRKPV